MKKLLALFLAMVLVVSMTACGGSGTSTGPSSNVENTQEKQGENTEAATNEETVAMTEEKVEATTEEKVEATTEEMTEEPADGIRTEFKEAMDAYEKFMDEYVAFMNEYKKNPADLSILADYAEYMKDYADFVEKFEKWEDQDLNTAELAYYIDVQARVSKKLLETAQ